MATGHAIRIGIVADPQTRVGAQVIDLPSNLSLAAVEHEMQRSGLDGPRSEDASFEYLVGVGNWVSEIFPVVGGGCFKEGRNVCWNSRRQSQAASRR